MAQRAILEVESDSPVSSSSDRLNAMERINTAGSYYFSDYNRFVYYIFRRYDNTLPPLLPENKSDSSSINSLYQCLTLETTNTDLIKFKKEYEELFALLGTITPPSVNDEQLKQIMNDPSKLTFIYLLPYLFYLYHHQKMDIFSRLIKCLQERSFAILMGYATLYGLWNTQPAFYLTLHNKNISQDAPQAGYQNLKNELLTAIENIEEKNFGPKYKTIKTAFLRVEKSFASLVFLEETRFHKRFDDSLMLHFMQKTIEVLKGTITPQEYLDYIQPKGEHYHLYKTHLRERSEFYRDVRVAMIAAGTLLAIVSAAAFVSTLGVSAIVGGSVFLAGSFFCFREAHKAHRYCAINYPDAMLDAQKLLQPG